MKDSRAKIRCLFYMFLRTLGIIVSIAIAIYFAGYSHGSESVTEASGKIAPIPGKTTFSRQGFTIPGFSYVGQEALERSLMDAGKTGANSVIFDYHLLLIGGISGSQVQADFPLDHLMQEVVLAKDLGFYTLVKPVLIVGGYNDPDHTNWQRIAPTDPAAWFASYSAQLMSLMGRPEAGMIDALILGNELCSMSTNESYKSRWIELISDIRSVFSGPIGYNAGGLMGPFDASREYLRVTFIDALDFIGISAYPRLSAKLNANFDDYRAGWTKDAYGQDLLEQLKNFLTGCNKDFYLTELGSPATCGGSYFFNPSGDVQYDLVQHAEFFDASLDVLATATGDRLRGVYIYNWHANPGKPLGFVPTVDGGAYVWNIYGKPAQDAIRRRYLKASNR